MTFKQFEATVKHFRNDIVVSKHGDYSNNDSKNTLGIIFIKDKKQSKVYDFSGTYSEVLNKLNITEFYEDSDIDFINNEIVKLEASNGRVAKLSLIKTPVNNTSKIEELKAQLEVMKSWYKII
jgi:hypothetical protein